MGSTSPTLATGPFPAETAEVPDPRRFRALAVIAIAQLMIVLDASVVTIALPSAQRALHISIANLQWVLTAYTLAFGGLLLLGGRIADYLGRKRMFVISLIGFAAASALGGLLTEYTSWRWVLLINTPIAAVTAIAALRVVHESRAGGERRYDLRGAVAVTGGLLCLVYGFTRAQTDGWGDSVTVGLLGAAAALLVAFVLVELRAEAPLLPLRVVLDHNRGGSYLASLLVGIGMFGTFLS